MYNSFIRAQLEYASVVWGDCRAIDSEKKLEKIQLHAARILLVELFLLLENRCILKRAGNHFT